MKRYEPNNKGAVVFKEKIPAHDTSLGLSSLGFHTKQTEIYPDPCE